MSKGKAQEYFKWDVSAGPRDSIEVSLGRQAHVRVMDQPNYQNYRTGKRYNYSGGLATKTVVHVAPLHQGRWVVVVDLQGLMGSVDPSVRVLR